MEWTKFDCINSPIKRGLFLLGIDSTHVMDAFWTNFGAGGQVLDWPDVRDLFRRSGMAGYNTVVFWILVMMLIQKLAYRILKLDLRIRYKALIVG